MIDVALDIPDKLIPIFETDKRYIDLYGGRGSGKSWTVADFLLFQGQVRPCRIMCTREIQKSISDSVIQLLSDKIQANNLSSFYDIQKNAIYGANGTNFLFKGLRHNPNDIKSTEGIDYCWVEEAQSVSRSSLNILTPTVRKDGSQIIFTYNPT